MLDHNKPIVARKSPFTPALTPVMIAVACDGDSRDAQDRANLRKVREQLEVTTVGILVKEAEHEARYALGGTIPDIEPLPWPLATARPVEVFHG